MLFAHLNDDLIGFAQEDFPGDAVGKNPPASAGPPPVRRVHMQRRNEARGHHYAQALEPTSHAY